MNPSDWRTLALTSITDPATAARQLLAFSVPREALWTALVLMAVLNAAIFTLSNILLPTPSPFPGLLNSPIAYFGIAAGGLILSIYAIFWIGRILGGTGALEDVMILLVWMQALRVVVQAVALVLVLTVPLLSALLVFAATLVGLYMLLHFVNQAHRFESLGRAAGVLIGAFVAIVLGLSLVLSLIGGPIVGSSLNV